MAYLALYRAFRPTTLNDVVRQEHIVTVLKNQISTGRIGHAYLFCGPRYRRFGFRWGFLQSMRTWFSCASDTWEILLDLDFFD